MEENQMIQVQRPTQPEPWRDLDDLIFQGTAGWPATAEGAVSLSETALPFVEAEENASARWERRRKKHWNIRFFLYFPAEFRYNNWALIGILPVRAGI